MLHITFRRVKTEIVWYLTTASLLNQGFYITWVTLNALYYFQMSEDRNRLVSHHCGSPQSGLLCHLSHTKSFISLSDEWRSKSVWYLTTASLLNQGIYVTWVTLNVSFDFQMSEDRNRLLSHRHGSPRSELLRHLSQTQCFISLSDDWRSKSLGISPQPLLSDGCYFFGG